MLYPENPRKALEQEAAATAYALDIIAPQILQVIGKFNGKPANKRFTDALEQIPGVYVRTINWNGVKTRYEIAYKPYGFEYDCVAMPGHISAIYLYGIETTEQDRRNPRKPRRINELTLIDWTAKEGEDLERLERFLENAAPIIAAYNRAVSNMKAALKQFPASYHDVFSVPDDYRLYRLRTDQWEDDKRDA